MRSAFALPVRLLLLYRAWRAARRVRRDEWEHALVSVLPTRVIEEREREQRLMRALRSPTARFLYASVLTERAEHGLYEVRFLTVPSDETLPGDHNHCQRAL